MFLGLAQRRQNRQRLSQEVPGPAAGIEHGDRLGLRRPAGEGARRRAPGAILPLTHEAQHVKAVVGQRTGYAQVVLVCGGRANVRSAARTLAAHQAPSVLCSRKRTM